MKEATTKSLIISDFTVGSLAGLLQNSKATPKCEVTIAPFDQVVQVMLERNHDCWSSEPNVVILWTRPERVSPSFASALAGEPVREEQVANEVTAFCNLVSTLENRVLYTLIPSWVQTASRRGLGFMDLKSDAGATYLLARMNWQLIEHFSGSRTFHVLDAGSWVQQAGKWAYSPTGWYLAKNPFGNEVVRIAAREIKAAMRALAGNTKKLAVLDLDGTIWGGVLGDVGWENLVIGGHDPIGEAFADFQRELKALRQRGVLLAVCSKNDEASALEAIDKHPEMILRRNDLVTWRINWNDKAENIRELVTELNIGLDAVVFLDDNPVERFRITEVLPQILVPDLPENKMNLASFIRDLDCFDTSFVSEIDRTRTELYQFNKDRDSLRLTTASIDEWLAKLDTSVTIEALNAQNRDRALQLLNKTNQMNLMTRRLTDSEFGAWSNSPENRFWTLRVKDRFGDSGLVGLMSLTCKTDSARIIDFVLSCRVMGRRIEETMLWHLLGYAHENGLSRIEAEFVPTNRNGPCLKFLENSGGSRDVNLFNWDASSDVRPPKHIAVNVIDGVGLEQKPTIHTW